MNQFLHAFAMSCFTLAGIGLLCSAWLALGDLRMWLHRRRLRLWSAALARVLSERKGS